MMKNFFKKQRFIYVLNKKLNNWQYQESLKNFSPVKNLSVKTQAAKTDFNTSSNKLINQPLDKGRMKLFVLWFLEKYGERKTLKLLDELKTIGFGYATKAGTSIGIEDLQIPASKSVLIGESEKLVYYTKSQSKRGDITEVEKFQRMIDSWHQTSETLKNDVVKNFEKNDLLNPVYMMAFSGARGNLSQVRQLVGMRGLMSDPQGRIIDFPIRSNFREGLTLTEYVISTYGARKGIVDTALRTANAGYLTRRLVDVAQHVIVSNFDCGTKRGIVVTEMKEGLKTLYSLPNRLLGRVLASDIMNKEEKIGSRNQEIFQELAVEISKNTSKVFIRSPLTCETRRLVCQLCYGWTLSQGTLVSIGEAVGIIAAQSIGEPGTQLTMRTFHTGGVFSGDLTEEVLAFEDGKVTYSNAIPGTLIRTPQGKIAFLTKNEGQLNFTGKTIKKQYKLPPFSILYARNEQNVFKKDLIAQISTKIEQKQQREDVEQKILSELEGVFYNGHVDLVEKINDYNDPIFEAQEWGYVWILSGKIYQLPIAMPFYPQSGDLVTPNSIMSQIQWKLPTKGKIDFVESNLLPKINSKVKSSLAATKIQGLKNKETDKTNSPLIIQNPIFSALLKSIQFKSIGYVLSTVESLSFQAKNWNKKENQFACAKLLRQSKFLSFEIKKPVERFFLETSLTNKKESFYSENSKTNLARNSLIRDSQPPFVLIKNTDEWRRNPTSAIQWFPQNLRILTSGLIKFQNLQLTDEKTKQLPAHQIFRYSRIVESTAEKINFENSEIFQKFASKPPYVYPKTNSLLIKETSSFISQNFEQNQNIKTNTKILGSISVIHQKFLTTQKVSLEKSLTNRIHFSYKKFLKKEEFEKPSVLHQLKNLFVRKKEKSLIPFETVLNFNAQGGQSFSFDKNNQIGWVNEKLISSKTSLFPIKHKMQSNIQNPLIKKLNRLVLKTSQGENLQTVGFKNFIQTSIQANKKTNNSLLNDKMKQIFQLKMQNSKDSLFENLDKLKTQNLSNVSLSKVRLSLIITKHPNSNKILIRFKESAFNCLVKETTPFLINSGWIYCSFEPQQTFYFAKKKIAKGKQSLTDLIFDHTQTAIFPLKILNFNSANKKKYREESAFSFNPSIQEKRKILPYDSTFTTNTNKNMLGTLEWIKNKNSRYFKPEKNIKNEMSIVLIQRIDEKILGESLANKQQLNRIQIESKQNQIQNFNLSFTKVRQKFHSNTWNKQIPITRLLSANPSPALNLEQIFQLPLTNFLKNVKIKEQKISKNELDESNRFGSFSKELTSMQLLKGAENESQTLEFLNSQAGKKLTEYLKTSEFFTIKKEFNFSYFILGLIQGENFNQNNFGNETLKIDFNLKCQFRLRTLLNAINSIEKLQLKKMISQKTLQKEKLSVFQIDPTILQEQSEKSNVVKQNYYPLAKNLIQNLSISSGLPFLTISSIQKKTFFLKTYKDQIRTKNTFILNSENTILPNSYFAKTGFLSSYTGEVLNIGQYFWTNRLNKNRSLILTKADLIGFSINSTQFLKSEQNLLFDKENQSSSGMAITKKPVFIKVDEKLFKVTDIKLGPVESKVKLKVGEFFVCGDLLEKNTGISESGQIIHLNRSQITLRKGQPIFVSPKGILNHYSGDFIEKNKYIITLPYQRLKTGDIIQGIPKVEQFFEARTTKAGKLFRDSVPNLLKGLFKHYKKKLPLQKAVRQSLYKIQQILVDGVQRVYRSQGVSISDKHIEVIVKQMTSKVRILNGGQTGFFPGEILDLDFVEEINRILLRKILYEPLILGITRASLEVDSFLAAASFQQTTKMLSRAALYRKKDFLKGLKENVILGNLIPAGTGYLVSIDFTIPK